MQFYRRDDEVKRVEKLILMLVLIMTIALTACNKEDLVEKSYIVKNEQLGLTLVPTEVEEKFIEKDQLILEEIPEFGIGMTYVSDRGIEIIRGLEGKTQEEVDPDKTAELIENMENYAILIRVPENEALAGQILALNDMFKYQEIIREDEKEGDVILFWKDDQEDIRDFTEKDQKELRELIDNISQLKENIDITERSVASSEIPDFETNTFSGETFTKKDFSNYDLTMINIWASWCGPCIAEMSDLQELKEMLPENMNMITLNADANENEEISREILEKNNATFETLIPDEVLTREILSSVQAFPTTIFINSEGEIVGEKIMGTPGGNIAEGYFKVMKRTLESIE